MRLLLSLIYILLFNITVSYSQVSFYFTEYPKKDSVLKVIEDIHRNQLKLSVDSESLKEVYKWRLKYTKCLFDTNAIVFEPQIYEYVGSIFDEIISSNSELKTLQLRYFVSNSPIPNSYSLGDGTIIINIGLIRKLKNEAQLAFVCCHEISHYLLNHSNNIAIERYNKRNSKKFIKEIQTISNQKYGKYEKIKTFLKIELYEQMTYSRQQERKADSVGLRLFLNTLYDPFESISCLNILDTIDKYKYQDNIDFDEVLGFEKYPFKQRWLEPGTIIFDAHSESDNQLNDSLKSHPDRKERIALLQSILSGMKNKHPKFVSQDSIFFSYLSEQLDYEFIESWIFYNDYGKAFFFTLKKLENEPKNQELLLKMSNIMRLIYNSREEHNYSNYVEKPNLENEKEYNNILYFLDNIRLVELANIAYYFHESHIEQVNRNSVFKENFNYFKSKSY